MSDQPHCLCHCNTFFIYSLVDTWHRDQVDEHNNLQTLYPPCLITQALAGTSIGKWIGIDGPAYILKVMSHMLGANEHSSTLFTSMGCRVKSTLGMPSPRKRPQKSCWERQILLSSCPLLHNIGDEVQLHLSLASCCIWKLRGNT